LKSKDFTNTHSKESSLFTLQSLIAFMDSILLIGHGSLKQASGAAMIRLAALLRQRGVVPLSTAAFLNFSKPTFQDGLERLLKKGATEIYVQPYFLIDGYYVNTALRKMVEEAQNNYPELTITMGKPFGVQKVLADIVIKRLLETVQEIPNNSAVVLMAHGTPTPEANAPIYEIASQAKQKLNKPVRVAFMECNEPTIAEAVDTFAIQGFETIIAMPYFLHLGSHVREDLPQIINDAKSRYPDKHILLSEHLGYDERFADIIADLFLNHTALTRTVVAQ
jgi:sirohydrochlorin cobaltochelatase